MRVAVVATAISLCVVGISAASDAEAAIRKPINIPAQGLGSALQALAKDRGFQVVYLTDAVDPLRTQGAVGEFTPEEALKKLLHGTGLTYRYLDEKTVTIFPVSASSSQEESGGASTQAPAKATKEQLAAADPGQGKDRRSFWDRFRLAQVDQGQTQGDASVEKQDEQASKKKRVVLEEVIVTGSRIPTVAGQTVLPVRSYSSKDIEQSGQTTIADFLNTLPDVSRISNGTLQQSNLSGSITPPQPGQTSVQLHGLPAGTTLTLLNGHRVASSALGFFDLSALPAAAVERVEVLPVGASAIYGADALGGAVNILLNNRFEGLQANYKFDHIVGENSTSLSVGWGTSWERASVLVMGTYQEIGSLFGSQRKQSSSIDFPSNAPIDNYIYTQCSPGNVSTTDGSNLNGLSSPTAAIPTGISGTPSVSQFAGTSGLTNRCNIDLYQEILPQSRQEGLFLSGHLEANDSADVYAEILASRYRAFMPYAQAVAGATLSATNPYNPFGEDVSVDFVNITQLPTYNNTGNIVRPLIGVRGRLTSNWKYDTSLYVSQDHFHSDQTDPNSVLSAFQVGLSASDLNTALNPFTTGALGTPQAIRSYQMNLGQPFPLDFNDRLIGAQGVLQGTLAHAPAGPISAAVGTEYGQERHRSSAIGGVKASELRRISYATFAETRIPLVADHRDHEALSLSLAARYDHSQDFGGKATWQSGLLWRISTGLSMRGSYGLSYKAPGIEQVGAGNTSTVFNLGPFIHDPFRGGERLGVTTIFFGANPNLKPETGNSSTFGLQYSSQRIAGLEASLTYYDLNISNYIYHANVPALVREEDFFPGAVLRSTPTPSDVSKGWRGKITQVSAIFYNFGDLRIAGVDADVGYSVDTRLGRFRPSVAVANLLKWKSALQPGLPLVSYLGQESIDSVGFAPRWKGTVTVAWSRGPLATTVAGRYLGPYKDFQDFVSNPNVLGNSWIIDMNVSWDVGRAFANGNQWVQGTHIALGAVNLFNKFPRFSYGTLEYDYQASDLLGRHVYAQVGVKW